LILALVLTPAFIPLDYFRIPDAFEAVVVLRLLACSVFALLYPITNRKDAEHWVVALSALVIALIAGYLGGTARLTQGAADPAYLHQAMALIFVILGVGLLLPFDGLTVLFLAGIAFVSQVVFTIDFDPLLNLPVLTLCLMAVIIAGVGAASSFATRLSDYETRSTNEALLRARSEFVAMLSHDIKNPLGVVSGWVSLLREDENRSNEEEEMLARIEAANQRALMLATNFLDVSKIESGPLTLVRQPTDVGSLINHVIRHQRSLLELKEIGLERYLPPDLPRIDADAASLDRVFANLLSNAIKFTPPGGLIRVLARQEDDRGTVVIDDSGEGIRPEALKRIFRPYGQPVWRSDSTGLGLYIVKTITEAHGGTVFAENRSDGTGARVGVTLPLAARSEEARAGEPKS